MKGSTFLRELFLLDGSGDSFHRTVEKREKLIILFSKLFIEL
jgi:hypothetical protein